MTSRLSGDFSALGSLRRFLFTCAVASRGGGQRGERGQGGVAGGHNVAPFRGEKVNLPAEGLEMLRLRFHELPKRLNILLVHASLVILELFALSEEQTRKQYVQTEV